MRPNRSPRHRWAVILAGGEGTRLLPVTKLIAGDGRPKQFCRLLTQQTLLATTRDRLQGIAPEGQTCFLLLNAHRPFFASEVADVDPSRLFIQPLNKGTTTAIAFGLMRLRRLDGDAVVGFFPSDHDFPHSGAFVEAVQTAYEEAEHRGDRIVTIGAQATDPDVEYGWIEPGPSFGGSDRALSRVTRFWEKPRLEVAEALFAQGCLWNTFAMVGRIEVFLNALAFTAPQVLEALCPLASDVHVSERDLADLYEGLEAGDFSKQVLSASTQKLAVVRLKEAGWTDLGTPPRLFEAMRRSTTTDQSHAVASMR